MEIELGFLNIEVRCGSNIAQGGRLLETYGADTTMTLALELDELMNKNA